MVRGFSRAFIIFVAPLTIIAACSSQPADPPAAPAPPEASMAQGREDTAVQSHWYNLSVFRPIWGDYDDAPEIYPLAEPVVEQRLITRGKYLVTSVSTCGTCHGADVSDPAAPLSGGATFTDRFGEVIVPNITPDRETGIGQWSLGQVMRAIRASIDCQGRPLSIEAHQNYRWLSDDDAKAIAYYLFSLPAKVNALNRRELGPFERNLAGVIPVHQDFKGYVPEVSPKATRAYGWYLASHAARCAVCHSSSPSLFDEGTQFTGNRGKLGFMAALSDLFLGGAEPTPGELGLLSPEARAEVEERKKVEGTYLGSLVSEIINSDPSEDTTIDVSSGFSPDIRGSAGLREWTEQNIVDYLSSGVTVHGRSVNQSSCPWNYYSTMNNEDKAAIATFLKSST